MPSLTDLLVEDIVFTYIFPYLDICDLLNLRAGLTECRYMVDTYLGQLKGIDWNTVPASQMGIVAPKTRNLTRLNLIGVRGLSDLTVATLLKKNKRIEKIYLTNSSHLSLGGVRQIGFLRHITVLCLARNQWVNNRFIHLLSTNLIPEQLKKVDFSECLPSDWAFMPFFEIFRWLEDINLESCPLVTWRTIQVIGGKVKSLIFMNIAWNRHVDEDTIRYLVGGCPAIRGINVTGCDLISQNFRDTVLKNILMQ